MDFTRGKTEIPQQVGLDEGRQEAAAGGVDVNGDVEPVLLL